MTLSRPSIMRMPLPTAVTQ